MSLSRGAPTDLCDAAARAGAGTPDLSADAALAIASALER
jgi:hypothetical protein